MASGNGAYIVHAELASTLDNYELLACNPYLAAIPGLPSPSLRKWLAKASIVHLSPNYGHISLPQNCSRVVTFHSFDIDPDDMEQASTAQRFYYRNVLRHAVIAATKSADRLVAVSKFVADSVRRHCPIDTKPVEVIYNGIDTQRFRPLTEVDRDRPLRVLFVGNPTRRKGFHLLAGLAEQLPDGVELAFTSGLRDEQVKTAHNRLVSLGHVPLLRNAPSLSASRYSAFSSLSGGIALMCCRSNGKWLADSFVRLLRYSRTNKRRAWWISRRSR